MQRVIAKWVSQQLGAQRGARGSQFVPQPCSHLANSRLDEPLQWPSTALVSWGGDALALPGKAQSLCSVRPKVLLGQACGRQTLGLGSNCVEGSVLPFSLPEQPGAWGPRVGETQTVSEPWVNTEDWVHTEATGTLGPCAPSC